MHPWEEVEKNVGFGPSNCARFVCIAGAVFLTPILWYGVGLLVVAALVTGVIVDMMEEDRLRSLSRRHESEHGEHEWGSSGDFG